MPKELSEFPDEPKPFSFGRHNSNTKHQIEENENNAFGVADTLIDLLAELKRKYGIKNLISYLEKLLNE
jgi:hypothetical protein